MIDRIARWSVRYPWSLRAALLALLLAAGVIIASRPHFDSEILNLLPASAPAVEGLKTFYADFEQARELAVVVRAPGQPDLVADFSAFLGERLNTQPWVVRWLDGSPLDSPVGQASLATFVGPLVGQLPPETSRALRLRLEPAALEEHLSELGRRVRAGSPAALLQWNYDPLGIFAPAVAPVLETTALEETFALTAPAGDLRVFSILTNQADLSQAGCLATMTEVRNFLAGMREEFGPEAPEVLVTGRSAYVEEISASMRQDIIRTSLLSFGGICLLFWLAYRRMGVLLGLALILTVSSLWALAFGLLLFPALNLIAIAFCSILFGLGQDFGFLLYEEARHEKDAPPNREQMLATALRRRWPGIGWVALTTALGFLALLAGESPGFSQLGVLTALGVALAALLVPCFFYAFLPRQKMEHGLDGKKMAPGVWPGRLFARPSVGYFIAVGVLALLALVLVLSPWRPLRFDMRPSSLEPADLPAALALQAILEAFPESAEPSLLILPLDSENPSSTARELENLLRTWKEEGRIRHFSIGSRLIPDPLRQAENQAIWQMVDWAGLHTVARTAAAQNGLTLDPNHPLLRQFEILQAAPPTNPAMPWRGVLPENSPWWFVLDRLVAPEGGSMAAYFQPEAGQSPWAWQEEVEAVWPGARLTGWAVMVRSLGSWAERELWLFGVGVSSIILVILALVYRDAGLWLTHFFGLVLAALLFLAALKIFNQPVNLLSVLGFPLLIGVGVDYATHLLLAVRDAPEGEIASSLRRVAPPVLLAGLSTMIGFGALASASNPSLRGLGLLCAVGVGACLASAFLFVLPWALRGRSRAKSSFSLPAGRV